MIESSNARASTVLSPPTVSPGSPVNSSASLPWPSRTANHRDRLGDQSARDERQCLHRDAVDPLRVVHDKDQRPALGGCADQSEHRQPDQEAIGRGAGAATERDVQRVALRSGQPIEVFQQRRAELLQRGERELHLALHTGHSRSAEPRRALQQEVEQRGLADTGFAPQHEHLALARAGEGRQTL